MTPRIKEQNQHPELSGYSELLFTQLNDQVSNFQLSFDGPLWRITHPALIKTKYLFESFPQELSFKDESFGWNLEIFPQKLPDATLGHPFRIFQFLAQMKDEGLFYFPSIGSIHLTHSPISKPQSLELYHYLASPWMDYALSPELWGEQGKWTRFHQRLRALFIRFELLVGKDLPGYYELDPKIQLIERHGFYGKHAGDFYQLVLPWDFPLSALTKLEAVIQQEF